MASVAAALLVLYQATLIAVYLLPALRSAHAEYFVPLYHHTTCCILPSRRPLSLSHHKQPRSGSTTCTVQHCFTTKLLVCRADVLDLLDSTVCFGQGWL